MPRRTVGNPVVTIIDFFSIIIGTYGIHKTILTIELPPHLADAGHWQFLTNLSLAYCMIVFSIGLLAHLTKSNFLFNLKNNLHTVALALEMVVASVYWPLRLFFLHLLTSDPKDFAIPMSVDLSIHLMPVVSLLVDYLVFMPKWTIKPTSALMLVVFLTVGYWYLLENLIDIENGAKYPYAFLNVEKNELRMVIFFLVGSIAFLSFFTMRKVYDLVVTATEEIEEEIDEEIDKKNA